MTENSNEGAFAETEPKASVAEAAADPAVAAALRVIEAVWSRGTAPASVQAVLGRFVQWTQQTHEDDTSQTPLARLSRAVERDGAEPVAASVFRNRQKLLTGDGGILKAEAVYRVAQILREHGAETEEAVCGLVGNADFEAAVCRIPGVGEATLRKLYALCGAGPSLSEVPAPIKPAVKRPRPKLEDELPLPVASPSPADPPATDADAAADAEPASPVKKSRKKKARSSDGEISTPPIAEGYHVRMREVPQDERPRERLISYGAESVSVEELLAILLRTGTEKLNAVDLAHHLLTRHGGMRGLSTLTVEEMSQIHGVGPAKACQIKAAIEFGRRLVALSPEERPKIRSPRDVYNLLGPTLRDEKREHLVAVLLDTKNGIIRQKTVSIGDLSSSLVHPREVFLEAIRHSSASLIVAHNHPSGDPSPSPEDVAVTRRLTEAGTLLGIEVLDHIIIGDGKWVSLKEKGLM